MLPLLINQWKDDYDVTRKRQKQSGCVDPKHTYTPPPLPWGHSPPFISCLLSVLRLTGANVTKYRASRGRKRPFSLCVCPGLLLACVNSHKHGGWTALVLFLLPVYLRVYTCTPTEVYGHRKGMQERWTLYQWRKMDDLWLNSNSCIKVCCAAPPSTAQPLFWLYASIRKGHITSCVGTGCKPWCAESSSMHIIAGDTGMVKTNGCCVLTWYPFIKLKLSLPEFANLSHKHENVLSAVHCITNNIKISYNWQFKMSDNIEK